MSLSSEADVRTWAFKPAHGPHGSDMSCLRRTGAAGDSPPWAWEPLSPAGTASANAVTWLLAHGLQAAGWRHGQSKHPAGSIWMALRREAPELPSGSSRCGQANPNIWLGSDSCETCLADAWNYMMLLPDLSNGRPHLSFVLQNLFLWVSHSQWIQIEWGEILGIFGSTNIHLFWLWLG